MTTKSFLKLESYVGDVKKLCEYNKTDSPIFSNLAWLCSVLDGCILKKEEDIKTFKSSKFFFLSEGLSKEDLDNAPDKVVNNARVAFYKIKEILSTDPKYRNISTTLPKNKIIYKNLSSKQKEAYNFQKVSGLLADYGYQTIKLADDWGGVDFIAQHLDGSFLLVQLKGRLSVFKKYEKKNIWVCFSSKGTWYIYPHDEVLEKLMKTKKNSIQKTYKNTGGYSFPSLSSELEKLLCEYKL